MNQLMQESAVVARLKALERSQARYRIAFLVTAAIAAVLCTTGARRQVEAVSQAKSFEVVNDDTKVLARFSSVNGKGELRTFRADGTPLLNLVSSTDDSGRVEIFNSEGKPIITLSSSTTGAGNVIVNTSSGSQAVFIGTTPSNDGGMWVYNAAGGRIATISTAAGTSNGLAETYDANGTRTGHLP
ncbi:MAG: hypothetical protein ACYC96_04530 [Fimbriimonadaceae bacterium]